MIRSIITLCFAMVAALVASSAASAQCGSCCPAPAPVPSCGPACGSGPMLRIQRPIIQRPIISRPIISRPAASCCPAPVPQIRNVGDTCYQRCISQGNPPTECKYICTGGPPPPPSPVVAPIVTPGCQPKPVAPCQPSCRQPSCRQPLFSRFGCR